MSRVKAGSVGFSFLNEILRLSAMKKSSKKSQRITTMRMYLCFRCYLSIRGKNNFQDRRKNGNFLKNLSSFIHYSLLIAVNKQIYFEQIEIKQKF